MILLRHTLSSILVLLGACERAVEGSPSASLPVDHRAAAAVAAQPAVAPDVRAPTMRSFAAPLSFAERTASRVADTGEARRGPGAAKTVYVCPMHPEITSETPGLCPKCNMKLESKPAAAEVRQVEDRHDVSSSP